MCYNIYCHEIYGNKIQSTVVISNSLISNNRLSRSENLVPVLTQRSTERQQKFVEKRRNGSLALTFSSLQTKTDTFANSVDSDQTACYESSLLDLHCLPFCFGICAATSMFNNVHSKINKMQESNLETKV